MRTSLIVCLLAAIAIAAIPPAGGCTKFPTGSTMDKWKPVSFSEDPTRTYTDDDGLIYTYNDASGRYERVSSVMVFPDHGEPYRITTVTWFEFDEPDPPIEGNPHTFTDYEEGVTIVKDIGDNGTPDSTTTATTDTGQVVSD